MQIIYHLTEKISKIGEIEEKANKVIDAKGKIVTPGFVDIHTNFDGQVTWDPYLRSSTYHGVTTIVTGNCGVGFSPCKPEQRDWLIGLMEGVEDIPGTALHEGIEWDWETFPEYLDVLEKKPLAIVIIKKPNSFMPRSWPPVLIPLFILMLCICMAGRSLNETAIAPR